MARVVRLSEVAAAGRLDPAFYVYTRTEKIARVRAGVARKVRALRAKIRAQDAIATAAAEAGPDALMRLFYAVKS